MSNHKDIIEAARELGREAGRAAGSWAADGNTLPSHARRVLEMIADGDPEMYDHLPRYPDLSGEWADAPTPRSLAEQVLNIGPDEDADDMTTAICDAWEEGVSETFEDACAAELRAILPDTALEVLVSAMETATPISVENDGDLAAELIGAARDLAMEWHSGQGSVLYGFGSTGDLVAWGAELIDLPTARYQRRGFSHDAAHDTVQTMSADESAAMGALRKFGDMMACAGLCGPMMYVIDVRYSIEDDGDGGSDVVYSDVDENGAPEPCREEWHTCQPDADDIADGETVASIAARILRDEGTTEDCGSWWHEPDGSHTVSYATGEQEETTAHPYGFTDEQLVAIGEELA